MPKKQITCVCSKLQICVFAIQHPSQRIILDQIKQKALSQRRVWPFVTHVADNLRNTTTKNSMFLHSLLFTLGNHFRRCDRQIMRPNLGEIISKRASLTTSNTGAHVVISEPRICQARVEHILCLYLPRCNGRYDNRSAWRKLKQDASLALLLLRADRLKRWLVSLKSRNLVLSSFSSYY